MSKPREKLLFLCSRNRWRSPTAERLFARSDRYAVRSRGLSSSAVRALTRADVLWADVIFVMEFEHKRRLRQAFRNDLGARPVHVLDIPDEFELMDPELIERITEGVEAVLGPS